MLPVAILAGGLATRLRPVTEKIPKALVAVAGEPFICHQLNFLKKQGIRRVVLCIGYLGEMIQEVVGDGENFGLDVTYSYDGPALIGTGGALRKAAHILGEQFFVLYGDSYLPVEFAPIEEFFMTSGKPALMTVLENNNRWDASNVLFRDGQLYEYNKNVPRQEMKFIDYGLSILSGSVLENYPAETAFDLAEVYHRLSLQRQLSGYEVHERFYEIGSFDGLKETEEFLLRQR